MSDKCFQLSISTYCQAKCRSCLRTNSETGEPEDWLTPTHMSVEAVQNLVSGDYFKKNKLGYLLLCGELGDPMMHPNIDKILDITLAVVPRVELSTNGGLRQPEWYAKTAQKYGSRIHIKWAIDGTDHETNWKYREGVDYYRAMDNMKAWIENGGNGDWHYLIFEWNWKQVKTAKQIAKDIGIEILFKINNRPFGLIDPLHKRKVMEELTNG